MNQPKCLRCGAGAEWIQGRVPDEPEREAHSLQRPCSAFLRVNYGINQRLQGRHFSHRNGKMRIKGNLADDATHKKIKAIIRRRHPGWNIAGWSLANTPITKPALPT